MMITVATTIEAPIKLVFPGPGRGSMVGLGDVVLPGIMMALALRFDLYLHYLTYLNQSSNRLDSTKKPPYVNVAGKWGERFWTWSAKEPTIADAARFKKVYFKASLIGYVIGLLITLVVLNIWKHGQPALLYLVPCVLVSLWGTALVMGKLGLMWGYTEERSLEKDENVQGSTDKKKGVVAEGQESKKSATDSVHGNGIIGNGLTKKEEHAQHVFLFSLTAPKKRKKALLFDEK